jgi:3-dehydrotetronate 4-kinase
MALVQRRLGIIADDFTGATDVASTLVAQGLTVDVLLGVPSNSQRPSQECQATVVALKSRTAPAAHAVEDSLAAARWLTSDGTPTQLYLKVCSTFDSTPTGNIGPVAQALLDYSQAPVAIVTPAFPRNGRSVYQGHLFVGDTLLHDSSMRNHPLTPMADSNLIRLLSAQLQSKDCVELIPHTVVARGNAAICDALSSISNRGKRFVVVDAICDADLHAIGEAAQDALIVAASGVAQAIGGRFSFDSAKPKLSAPRGHQAVLSGSCSHATLAQVEHFCASGGDALALDPLLLANDKSAIHEAISWASERLGNKPVLVYASAETKRVKAVQAALGVECAGKVVEAALGEIACALVRRGVGQLIVAGGETSGACVQALKIDRLRVGREIDPGVPWCYAEDAAIHIALKSGNFGAPDFFTRAFTILNND